MALVEDLMNIEESNLNGKDTKTEQEIKLFTGMTVFYLLSSIKPEILLFLSVPVIVTFPAKQK